MENLKGKVGLIVGIANEQSIATGCAHAFAAAGAALAITYLNEKAKPHVAPIAEAVDAKLLLPLNVEDDVAMKNVFEKIQATWGRLDFILHSIAFCPKDDLHGRVVDCSRGGFLQAMDTSVHSFMRMARLAEPLMTNGGCLLTMSYYGAEKVVDNYNIMGTVKAALQAASRYLAADLGPKNIRVNVISPGPVMTRAASGIDHFDELIEAAKQRAPQHRIVTIDEVGSMAAHLVSDDASSVTGNLIYVDAGFHITT